MDCDDRISIDFMGKSYRVSKDTTLLGALLEVGWDSVKGLGCMGGCCGACAAFYRLPDESHVRSGLACRTPVQDGLSFSLAGQFHSPKANYNLSEISNPEQALFDLYPEVTACRSCGLCGEICPQGIDSQRGMWCATFGDFAEVSELFKSCVQCGLCARVCSVGIRPYLVGVYASRVQGSLRMEPPLRLLERVNQIESGAYKEEWKSVLESDDPPVDENPYS